VIWNIIHGERVVYLALAVAAFCFWILSASNVQFTTVPLVFALGSLALRIKGIFLLRKSSEGLGLSDQEPAAHLLRPALGVR
jgi:hypothetical protein